LDGKCALDKDIINECIEKMAKADGIILGSPTYFSDLTPELKALIDRSGFVGKANGDMFKRKVGAAVVAVRRAGAIHVFDSINHFFLINQMVIPGSSYWNIGMGLAEKDVERDPEGIQTMRVLGQNMGWLMKKLKE
jgi:multimeric flavodoxin WrbA